MKRRMNHGLGVVLAGLMSLAGQQAGAGSYALPQFCRAHLTVQMRGCTVSHYYRCDGDVAGAQWRVDIGAEGPYFLSQTDREGQWLLSQDLLTGIELHLATDNPDPASISELLSKGRDSYDFSREVEGVGSLRVRGYDMLTGKRVTIDGVELEETGFEYRETGPDGAETLHASGQEYVHRDWRLFFSGRYDSGSGQIDRSPIRFDEPGDKGFLTDTPEYDCTAQMAALPVPGSAVPATAVSGLKLSGPILPVRATARGPIHLYPAASAAPVAASPKE